MVRAELAEPTQASVLRINDYLIFFEQEPAPQLWSFFFISMSHLSLSVQWSFICAFFEHEPAPQLWSAANELVAPTVPIRAEATKAMVLIFMVNPFRVNRGKGC